MDPRDRADEILARASARGAFVITPDNATSPMDASATVRIPRELINGSGQQDPNSTAAIPQSPPEPETPTWPQHEYGQVQPQPGVQQNPYQSQYIQQYPPR
jgi:hypothetical protein